MNKIKVAIYGDSYADQQNDNKHFRYDYLPWGRYLKQNTNLEVKNYALQGSSFQYSASLFLKTYTEYDKIVFIVTAPGRLWINNPDLPKWATHIANIRHLYAYINQFKKDEDPEVLERIKPILTAAKDYFLHIYDHNQIILFHDALFEKLERLVDKSNIIFIPTGPGSIPGYNDKIGTTLAHISGLDDRPANVMDLRPNHLNNRNNIQLAKKIDSWITSSKFSLNISDFFRPAETPEQLWGEHIDDTNWWK